MYSKLRKFFFIFTLNFSFFLLLMVGIQNSAEKRKVNFIVKETISLPIGFIMGVGFISGSITASILTLKSNKQD